MLSIEKYFIYRKIFYLSKSILPNEKYFIYPKIFSPGIAADRLQPVPAEEVRGGCGGGGGGQRQLRRAGRAGLLHRETLLRLVPHPRQLQVLEK